VLKCATVMEIKFFLENIFLKLGENGEIQSANGPIYLEFP
jgi:hypothetical protein